MVNYDDANILETELDRDVQFGKDYEPIRLDLPNMKNRLTEKTVTDEQIQEIGLALTQYSMALEAFTWLKENDDLRETVEPEFLAYWYAIKNAPEETKAAFHALREKP